ncbi:MAG TPA: tetratricopeptide repeat protein [bacterium]|nr:tetratricopeptide repeat protein [bacterium]
MMKSIRAVLMATPPVRSLRGVRCIAALPVKSMQKLWHSILLVLLILFFLPGLFCTPRLHLNKRMVVFPVIDRSFRDDLSWMGWHLSSRVIDGLQRTFSADTLVYPLDWIWEAVDLDSVSSTDYLLAYARRIGTDWAIVTQFESECVGCPLQWRLFDAHSGQILRENEIAWDPQKLQELSRIIAADVCAVFRPYRSTDIETENGEQTRHYAAAEMLLAQGLPQQALPLAQQAYLADTSNVESRNLLSRSHFRTGLQLDSEGKNGQLHYLIALRLSERTIMAFDSANAEAHRLIGNYYLTEENWHKAEQHLLSAVESDPRNARIYFDVAHLHRSRLGGFGFRNEEQVLKRAIDLNPAYEEARLYLADYLFFNNWKKHAERAIDALLTIHPRSINGLLALGKMAVAENNLERVIAIYNSILQIDPYNPVAYFNLGVYYFNLQEYEYAEQLFHRAVQYGDYADAHLYLGTIFELQGDKERAIAEYRLRIRTKRGPDDIYADRAMERLFELTQPDSTMLRSHVRSK